MGRGSLRIALALAGLLAAVAPACAQAASGDAYHATIRRTTHGIPHVLSSDWGGLGYGYGYAFAQDNLCQIADSYVTVNTERARYFGPDASWSFRSNGTNPNNLNSDIFFKKIIDDRVIEGLLAKAPPRGPRPEVREIVRGYVAGYDRYLADTGVDNLPDPTCRGKPWVRPITEIDAYRRFYQLALLASQGVAIDGIAGAAPAAGAALPLATQTSMLGELKQRLPLGGIGSNAVGLGSQATDNGRGMLLGNPHFPWDGTERFYQAQLTIPGRINVTGGGLFGVPLVLIGHTRDLAWSHTVSTAYRFTPFEERLVPGSPTTYLVDGQPRQMKSQHVTVQTRRPDGTLENRTRTLYSTVHGPVFTSILGLPLFPWTPVSAYAMGDANAPNFRYLNHFFETDRAQSTTELDQILRRNQGIPWVNTIAADSRGKAYYADQSVVPNVPDAKAQACDTSLGAVTYAALRLPVLDGSRTACNWDNDPDALQPGHLRPEPPAESVPRRLRHELQRLLLAFQPQAAADRLRPDHRRRAHGARAAHAVGTGDGGRAPGRGPLLAAQPPGHGVRQPPVRRRALPRPARGDVPGQLDADRLERARGRERRLSRPARLGPPRQPRQRGRAAVPALRLARARLRRRRDRKPHGLRQRVRRQRSGAHPERAQHRQPAGQAGARRRGDRPSLQRDPARCAAARASVRAARRGKDPDPRRSRHARRVQRHQRDLDAAGRLPGRAARSSFVQAVQFGGGSCPRTRTILTYSQSTNPRSPYFSDQTRMFSRKEWVPGEFCEGDIRDDRQFTLTEFGARRSCAKRAKVTLAALHARGRRVRRVDGYVNGRRVKVFRGRSLHRITLRSLPRGAFTLTLVSRTSAGRGGRRITSVHRFGGCR